jgi:hypothetical protein
MFVYFNAEDAQVKLSIDSTVAGYADNAQQLAHLLRANNVTQNNDMYFSSSVDFASEEGFATDDCAHNIINSAVAQL